MPISKIKIIVLLSFVIASECFGADLYFRGSAFSEYQSLHTKTFQKLEITDTLGGYPLLPIGGELFQIYTKLTYATGGPRLQMGRLTVLALVDKKYIAAVDMRANLEESSYSDWIDEPCKRDNYIWKRSTGGPFKNINCVSINHVVNYMVNPKGDFQQLKVILHEAGIDSTPTIIRVAFTRYSSNGRRLVYTVDINPENFGIERDATIPWGSNSWHKNFINSDHKKIEFVDKLKKWAIDVQDKMDNAFEKDKRAFSELKPLKAYLIDGYKPEILTQKVIKQDVSNIEDKPTPESRLNLLKKAYENGLLTDEEYKKKREDIISKM